MLLVDHIFIALLLIVQPLYDTFDYRRYVSGVEQGKPLKTSQLFMETIVRDWLALAVFLGAWIYLQRPFSDLGFIAPGGTGFWIALGLVIVALLGVAYSNKSTDKATAEEREAVREKLGALQYFLPRNNKELKIFYGLSVTAGIAEEIIFRGFLIWYLAMFMPLWLAAIASAVLFGICHSYQGVSGTFRTGFAGLIMTGLYLLSGSIWLPIVAHILGDALQGPMFVGILGETSTRQSKPLQSD